MYSRILLFTYAFICGHTSIAYVFVKICIYIYTQIRGFCMQVPFDATYILCACVISM